MILIPIDVEGILQTVWVAFFVEAARILIGYVLARPSSETKKLEAEKVEVQIALAKIKSVQLEFVEHSLLSRKVIKIDKQLSAICEAYIPKAQRAKKIMRIFRAVSYVAYGFLLAPKEPLLSISSEVFYPVSWVFSGYETAMGAFFLVLVSGAAARQFYRVLLSVVIPATAFP